MKQIELILFIYILFFTTINSAQEATVNVGLDTSNPDRKEIISLWTNYLKSNPYELNNNPYWIEEDKNKYKSYDLLRSEGFVSPSIYAFQLDNKILSITKYGNDYIIKSAFIYKETLDIYAIINVVARKKNNTFYLTNFQPIITSNWNIKTIGSITYHYFSAYEFKEDKAQQANQFLESICAVFSLKKENVNYFICEDCDAVSRVKGFDYVFTMGNTEECGFYDSDNKIVYATQLAGENHQHEITHIINDYFPNANSLLLTGMSAYFGGEKAHKGKPLIYHIKRVNDYLKKHNEINLNQPNDFWKLDEETNPQYVIGALLCNKAIEKGGIELLKKFLNTSKSDEELLLFIEKELEIKKGELNAYLRKKISDVSNKNKFDRIGLNCK